MDTFKQYQDAMSEARRVRRQISRAILQAAEKVSVDSRIKYVAIPNNDYDSEPGWALSVFTGTDNRSSTPMEFKMFFFDGGGTIAYRGNNKVVYIENAEALKRLIRTEYLKAAQAYIDDKDKSAVHESQQKIQRLAGLTE